MVPSTALIRQVADTLAADAPIGDGYNVGDAPAGSPTFYGIVYRINATPLESFHHRNSGLAVIAFQVTIIAPTQYQADRAIDRVSRTLTAKAWPTVADDVGAWAQTCRWLSIDVAGEPFSAPRPIGPFQAVGLYDGTAGLE